MPYKPHEARMWLNLPQRRILLPQFVLLRIQKQALGGPVLEILIAMFV